MRLRTAALMLLASAGLALATDIRLEWPPGLATDPQNPVVAYTVWGCEGTATVCPDPLGAELGDPAWSPLSPLLPAETICDPTSCVAVVTIPTPPPASFAAWCFAVQTTCQVSAAAGSDPVCLQVPGPTTSTTTVPTTTTSTTTTTTLGPCLTPELRGVTVLP